MSDSEQLPTGKASIEASHGITPAPISPEPAEPSTYGPGIEGVREAANDLSRERQPPDSDEPVERFLEWKSGPKAGQRVDLKAEHMSLTAETAAKTLSEVHRTEDAIEAHTNLSELAREVDLARSQLAGQPPPDAPVADATTAQPAEAPQPEYGEQPSGLDPEVSAALQNPKVRAAIEASVAPAEQARQQYAAATAQVAGMLVAELAADLPEIIGLPPEQRMVGLQILQKQQPERYAAFEAKAARIQQVVNAQLQNNAFEAHQRQEQYKQWAKAQDKALEAKVPEIANDSDMKVSRAALKSLKDVGYTEEELAAAWNGQPFSMRDHRAQLLIWKASRYDQIQATAHANPASRGNIPAVQRPGIAPSPGERSAVDLSELRNEFKKATGNRQLQLGARLTRLQRESRR